MTQKTDHGKIKRCNINFFFISQIFSLINAITYFAALFPALPIKIKINTPNNNLYGNSHVQTLPPSTVIGNEQKIQPDRF